MKTSYLAVAVSVLFLGACGDDGSPNPTDGGGSGSAALYDTCTDAAQCMSGNCRMFNMPSPGFQICTQSCSASMPCPMQDGMAVECTNANVCRPMGPNE